MTLAQITRESRVILKVGGSAAVVVILLFLIFQAGSFIQKTFFPAPPAAPEEKFGKLSDITFPDQTTSIPEFKINTVSGVLPHFPSQIKVYKLFKNPPTITALPAAKQRAAKLGYTQNEYRVTPDTYRWSNTFQNSFLLYNIISLNFSVDSDYLTRGDFVSGGVTNTQDITRTIREFVETLDANTTDIDFSKSNYQYYVSSNNVLTQVSTDSNATFARVYLQQNSVDNLNIYYPTTDPTLLYFTIGNNSSYNLVEASYNHFAPDLSQSSTYSIKSVDMALEDLKNGKGYILNSADTQVVEITEVSLGYYLGSDLSQDYLMPIFVFSGKDNFRSYVSAINQ